VRPAYADWKYFCGQYHHLSNGDIWVLSELYGGTRPPRTFALVSPAHRALVGAAWMATFEWGTSDLADFYHLQVDDDPYFASPEIDVAVGGTVYEFSGPLPAGHVYFWRVTAENGTGVTEARPRPVQTFLTESVTPSVLYVDDSSAPGGTGASWSSAFRDLNDALAIADCSGQVGEIRVGQGLYKPDRGTGDRDGAFHLTGGVHIKGGYAGVGAANPDHRDPSLHPTVLTADLAGDDQPGFVNYEENSRHVVSAVGVSPACTLDGLTITAGNADGVLGQRGGTGGGVFSRDSHIVLNNCRFTHCSAYLAGGGVNSVDGGSVGAIDCVFEDNRTTWPIGGAGAGAGLNVAAESAVTLIGCTFRGNTGFQSAGANIQDIRSGLIRDCVFEDNVASQWSGALQVYRGRTLVVDRCIFTDNMALAQDSYAGAFGNYGLASCGVGCVSTLTNCLFIGNTAAFTGGAINNDDSGTTRIINCTIVENSAAQGRGGGIANTSDFGGTNVLTVANAIVRANPGGQIRNIGSGSNTLVTYSNVQGGFAGTGNINADPLFADPNGGDYRLSLGSPSIDAGDPAFAPQPGERGLDGRLRIWDGDGNGSRLVDMGAYEFGSPLMGDLNCDGATDAFDIEPFVLALTDPVGYGTAYPNCDGNVADINGDGAVDAFDIEPFIQLLVRP
jgi:predicted outer membrane repeat protein